MSSVATALRAPEGDQLSRRNFERLARFVGEYSGIKLPPAKHTMLEGRLRKRLRATGLAGLDDYCDYVFDHGGMDEELIHLIDVVTTNKTDFFREPQHFDFLRDVALPELSGAVSRELRVWSSACSSGAEPYTLAMVLEAFFAARQSRGYRVLATDLSVDMLQTARRGVYSTAMLEPVPVRLRKYVLEARDRRRQEARIHPALRSRVSFGRVNLMDDKYDVGDKMHVIFCRNVLIYFDKPTQAKVLAKLCDRLAVGGYLFIGHSESITGVDLPVRQAANTIFRRI